MAVNKLAEDHSEFESIDRASRSELADALERKRRELVFMASYLANHAYTMPSQEIAGERLSTETPK